METSVVSAGGIPWIVFEPDGVFLVSKPSGKHSFQ